MQRRNISEAETKLAILYALDRLGPVTDMQLLQFMADNDMMNYFTLQLNLAELLEQGQVAQQSHPLGQLLTLSESGAYALSVFAGRIPASSRALIDDRAPAAHQLFRADQQTPAITLPDAGTPTVRLCLMEGGGPLLDIVLALPQGCTLTFLQHRWRLAAQTVFDAVTQYLNRSGDPAAPLPELPPDAALTPDGKGSWTLTLTAAPGEPAFTLSLALPDKQLAHRYASVWPELCAPLRRTVLQTLLDAQVP